MKKITCSKVGGGECDFAVSANTEEEMIAEWHKHYAEAHADMVANVSEEDKKKWIEGHHKIWEETPDEE